uniref:Mitochondrial ATP synthase subunit epsilon n=1 Tax=Acartia pacifica TaxID=335913 RepID=A0A0U2V7D8_ACAPC|nr:mitochondrial ATP synthase subunit epsilon [Acartia pacifica]
MFSIPISRPDVCGAHSRKISRTRQTSGQLSTSSSRSLRTAREWALRSKPVLCVHSVHSVPTSCTLYSTLYSHSIVMFGI